MLIDIKALEFTQILRSQKIIGKRAVRFVNLYAHLLGDALFKRAGRHKTIRMQALKQNVFHRLQRRQINRKSLRLI